MAYGDKQKEINALEEELAGIRKKILKLRKDQAPQEVKDYALKTQSGESVNLSQLFGDKEDLILIHNMGRKCPYCTLWADGFNGVVQHFENRSAFVVSSPDAPEIQKKFAESRGWKFRMVSTDGTTFAKDLEFQGDDWIRPGVSVFKKSGKKILRVSDATFGPGDDFSSVWHFFDLLPEGANDWAPKFNYRD